MRILFLYMIAPVSVLLASAVVAQSNQEQIIRLGTASPTGNYFPIGTKIKELCERNIPQISIEVLNTGGSVDNIKRIRDGALDMAIVQNDIAYLAESGMDGKHASFGPFPGPYDGLAAIMTFYPEPIYIITSNKNATRLGQLEGLTISIGPNGSGTSVNAVTILEEADLRNAVAVQYDDKATLAALFVTGQIQAAFLNSFPSDVSQMLEAKEHSHDCRAQQRAQLCGGPRCRRR